MSFLFGSLVCSFANDWAAHELQATLTDEFCSDPWVCALLGERFALCKRTRYRMVLGVVGYSLMQLRSTRELLHATYDVLEGMFISSCEEHGSALIA